MHDSWVKCTAGHLLRLCACVRACVHNSPCQLHPPAKLVRPQAAGWGRCERAHHGTCPRRRRCHVAPPRLCAGVLPPLPRRFTPHHTRRVARSPGAPPPFLSSLLSLCCTLYCTGCPRAVRVPRGPAGEQHDGADAVRRRGARVRRHLHQLLRGAGVRRRWAAGGGDQGRASSAAAQQGPWWGCETGERLGLVGAQMLAALLVGPQPGSSLQLREPGQHSRTPHSCHRACSWVVLWQLRAPCWVSPQQPACRARRTQVCCWSLPASRRHRTHTTLIKLPQCPCAALPRAPTHHGQRPRRAVCVERSTPRTGELPLY